MNNINAIKFLSEWTSIISLAKIGETSSVSLEYSYNGIDWSVWDLSGLTVNPGDILYIRGYNLGGFSSSSSDYYTFIIEGDKVSCSGNIMSLIDYKNLPDVIPCEYCFYGLFSRCTALTSAPELPASKLTDRCYSWMFECCTSLKIAPELPATTLAYWCYSYMFYGCSSLIAAPELPAKKLKYHCYDSMFSRCTSLTVAPELPATALAESCYESMFEGCTSLTVAPELPATELIFACYSYMFYGCTALTTAPELPANISKLYYMYMFDGCKIQDCTLLKDKKQL